MPRKTPVRELNEEENSQVAASPLRRSSRLASPGPAKLLDRRSSASDLPAKLPKAKRLSLSQESDDVAANKGGKVTEKAPDTPRRSTRSTRSASKSPSSFIDESENKTSSVKTRTRQGSISKIVEEEELNSESNEGTTVTPLKAEKIIPKSNKEPAVVKPKPVRKLSTSEKASSLQVIEELSSEESRTPSTSNASLTPIVEFNANDQEVEKINSLSESIQIKVEVDEVNEISDSTKKIVEEKTEGNVSTEKGKETEELVAPKKTSHANDTPAEISTDLCVSGNRTPERIAKDASKMSPVVKLSSIEKQLNHSEEKHLSKTPETSSKKVETKSSKLKSPVVVLQSIEKLMSAATQEYDNIGVTESTANRVDDTNKNSEKLKNVDSNKVSTNNTDLDESANDNDKELSKKSKQSSVEKCDELVKVNEGKGNEMGMVNEDKKDNQKPITENGLQKEAEDNKKKELLSPLLINKRTMTEGLDGSFNLNISLPSIESESPDDKEGPCKVAEADVMETVANISNTSENSDKENRSINASTPEEESPLKKKKSDSKDTTVVTILSHNIIKPLKSPKTTEILLVKDTLKDLADEPGKAAESSFYEPMEIEYTDFNCTVNLSRSDNVNIETSLVETDKSDIASTVENNLSTAEKEHSISMSKLQEGTELKNVEESGSLGANKALTDQLKTDQDLSNKTIEDPGSLSLRAASSDQSKTDQDLNNKTIEECETATSDQSKNDQNLRNKIIEETSNLEAKDQSKIDSPDGINLTTGESQKSISFAFNLDDEHVLSDEEIVNESLKQNDNDRESNSEGGDIIPANDGVVGNIDKENERGGEHSKNSPSPVFSVNEEQCISDDDEVANSQSIGESNGIENSQNKEKENVEPKETTPRSPSPTFSVDEEECLNEKDPKKRKRIDTEKSGESQNNGEASEVSEDEASQNVFIDGMAEEGEEDTPSEGSNDIPIEGESLNSVDTSSGTDDSYESDSFIDDDEECDSLLSGEDNLLNLKKSKSKKDSKNKEQISKKKVRARIISVSESDDESEIKIVENVERKSLEPEVCDSDDKMSTDPYLGLTPPSHLSVQESSSDMDVQTIPNENEIIINDDDNLKSLEEMRAESVPTRKQVDVVKVSSIICLDSDEDSSSVLKTNKLVTTNEQNTPNTSSCDPKSSSTKQSKTRSSINIQQNIKLDEIQDGNLSEKISKVVDFFYSSIKQNSDMSGNISLNVSLDFSANSSDDDSSSKPKSTEVIQNIEKVTSPKKRRSTSFKSSEKEPSPKKKKSAQVNISGEQTLAHTSQKSKSIEKGKRKQKFEDKITTTTSLTRQENSDIDNTNVTSKKKKSLLAETTVEIRNDQHEKTEFKKSPQLVNKAPEDQIPKRKKSGKKHKKTEQVLFNYENDEYEENLETVLKKHSTEIKELQKTEVLATQIKNKKKRKKDKEKKTDITEEVVSPLKTDETNFMNTNKKNKKKKSKTTENELEQAVISSPVGKEKQRKKIKSKKLITNLEVENDENILADNTQKQNKTTKRKRHNEISVASETIEESHTSNIFLSAPEPLKKKRRGDAKRIVPSSSDVIKWKTEKQTIESVSYFPSHMLEQISTTVFTEVPKIKKTDADKKLKKKQEARSKLTLSSGLNSDSWQTSPLKKAIVPSANNDYKINLQSDAGTSKAAKKHKKRDVSDAFSANDFKNKMLYDSNRVKRMSTKQLLKNKMKNI